MCEERNTEIWGGIEGTINRVGDRYFDQSEYSGHYKREGDIDLIASLGITRLRYPVLWEKHQPQKGAAIDWSHAEKNLNRLRELQIEPIAGLVHHGSGPLHVNFFDGSFEQGLAAYARRVAKRFPWLEYYTPVNEPLTTARFCGLYGHWYPHLKDNLRFYKILLSECRATVMAMKAIREINPRAKLIQTEDLSKTYGTPLLQYQVNLENRRRWLSYDLLCGRVNEQHPLWDYLTRHVGLAPKELHYFTRHCCIPDICGFNYYITSERYLDEDLPAYPEQCHGGNNMHRYADVELVRVPVVTESGPAVLLREAYEHLRLPIAVTECHLHCTREEQMRWFHGMWHTVNRLKQEGVDIRALTAWALLGAYGWDTLVTKPWGTYEPGAFNIRAGRPQPTALARLIGELAQCQVCHHPLLGTAGWWNRDIRILYPAAARGDDAVQSPAARPLLILEDSGALSTALSATCYERNIHHVVAGKNDLQGCETKAVEKLLSTLRPWAVVCAGVHGPGVSHAGTAAGTGFGDNARLAAICRKHGVKLAAICSNFSGQTDPSWGKTTASPNGKGDQLPESSFLEAHPDALLIYTGNLFGPCNHINFITATLKNLKQGKRMAAARDIYAAITYVPHLLRETLDLLLDDERGMFYMVNQGKITWTGLARKIAEMAGYNTALINSKPVSQLLEATASDHPSAACKRINLPSWQQALQRYFATLSKQYRPDAIAV